MSADDPRWAYLDLEGPGVRREAAGIVVAGGMVTLAPVAGGPRPAGAQPGTAAGAAVAAGIAADADGNLYAADPAGDAVRRIDGCDGRTTTLRCLPLRRPQGVAAGAAGRLLVADTGNRRIVAVDLASGQTAAVWEGGFDAPTDLAVDAAGRVYVVDAGRARVQRLDAYGRLDEAFGARMDASRPGPREPQAVAVAVLADGAERVLVVDARPGGRSRVLVHALDGAVDAVLTRRLASVPGLFGHPPGGVAAGGERIYVGDPLRNRVLAFAADGTFLGPVPGYRGAVAGLELDALGRLVVHAGAGAVARFGATAGVASGRLVAGPFPVPGGDAERLVGVHAESLRLPEGARCELLAWCGRDRAAEPPPLPAAGESGDWVAGPSGAGEVVLGVDGHAWLWVAVLLEAGEGGAPAFGRLRADASAQDWLRSLPALYAADERARPFLERLLALLAAGLGGQQRRIDDLPLLFDAAAAPEEWLEWLAGWVGLRAGDLPGGERRRAAVGDAFTLAARRGTAAGLRAAISLSLGAEAWIDEPGARADPWRLGADGALGFGTALAPAAAQGAVLGTTATLDASSLVAEEDFGTPLFEDVAHRFCVGVHARDVAGPGAREALERLVDRERPAHTAAHVCVVEPRGRVGAQARVGVDAVVAGPPPPLALGRAPLGAAATAAGAGRAADTVGRTRVGQRGG